MINDDYFINIIADADGDAHPWNKELNNYTTKQYGENLNIDYISINWGLSRPVTISWRKTKASVD